MRRLLHPQVVAAGLVLIAASVVWSSWSSRASMLNVTTFLPLVLAYRATPSPTPTTPTPALILRQDTVLLGGPDCEVFKPVRQLPSGSLVHGLGVFADFVEVETELPTGSCTGFVLASALEQVPTWLPELTLEQVPWHQIDIESYFSIHPRASITAGVITVDNGAHDYYDDYLALVETVSEPFRLSFAIFTSGDQVATIKLANKPNRVDELWWQGIRRLDLATEGGTMRVEIRDGRSQAPLTLGWRAPDHQNITLSFLDPHGKVLQVLDQSGNEIYLVDITRLPGLSLQDGLFPDGKVFFGRVVSPGSQLMIKSLALAIAPSGTCQALPVSPAEATLRELARRRDLDIGTEFQWFRMSDPRYQRTLTDNFDTLSVSEFSDASFWRGRRDYDFTSVDNLIAWMRRHNFRVRASHLVYGKYETVPQWLLDSHFTRAEYLQILEEHVKTVVAHYRDTVDEWSIANEAVRRCPYAGNDFWCDKIGSDYIQKAFEWARGTDPDGILIFNEDNNECPRDTDSTWIVNSMLGTVNTLQRTRGLLDAVGMQMHYFLPWNSSIRPEKQCLIDTMRLFAAGGARIYITEMDVNLHAIQGTQAERWAYEAGLYRDAISACLESGKCNSFSTWGVSDSTSWLTCTEWDGCLKFEDADPLLFDRDYRPKPAYYAIREVLAGQPDTATAK